MNIFDLIILAILAALTLRGIWKGMISQIVSVASLFVCWIVAAQFGGLVAPTIPVEAPWNQVLAMAVVFLITYVAIQFARAALEKLIKDWHLQKLNTHLGGVLGFVKGLLICMIITFFAVMLSETSRTVVFNSMTGFHLVRLITGISLFVPKDSCEFVHTQLAQFQAKVDEAVPGQTPETLKVQNSEMVQQALAQLQQTKEKETKASSLLSALSKWWNGEKEDNMEDASLLTSQQSAQTSVSSPSQASSYTPPMPTLLPVTPFVSNTQSSTPQQATAPVELFYARQPEESYTPPPVVPGLPAPQQTLTPLSGLQPLPESEVPLPSLQSKPNHVGSDLLLHNFRQPVKPNVAAQVFRPR